MTAQEEFKAFLDAQKQPTYDYAGMTLEQRQAEQDEYTRLKIAVGKEEEAVKLFNEEWASKESEIRARHDSEIQAHFQERQTAYDAKFV